MRAYTYERSEVLGKYNSDFYKGMSAVTKNAYGKGTAYYIAFVMTEGFTKDFCAGLIDKLNVTERWKLICPAELPRIQGAQTKEMCLSANYGNEPAEG